MVGGWSLAKKGEVGGWVVGTEEIINLLIVVVGLPHKWCTIMR